MEKMMTAYADTEVVAFMQSVPSADPQSMLRAIAAKFPDIRQEQFMRCGALVTEMADMDIAEKTAERAAVELHIVTLQTPSQIYRRAILEHGKSMLDAISAVTTAYPRMTQPEFDRFVDGEIKWFREEGDRQMAEAQQLAEFGRARFSKMGS